MFKALLIQGTPVTVDLQYWEEWIGELALHVIHNNGYRVSHTRASRNSPRKKTIYIVDPFHESKSYEWLTYYDGYRKYAGLMTSSNTYLEWLIVTSKTLGIHTRADRDLFSEYVIEYMLKEPLLKDIVLRHDCQIESVKNVTEHHRINKIVESLRRQAEEIGIELMFFTDEKFNLYYVLGDLYKVKASNDDATLRDGRDLVGKDFVDFS